MICVAQVLAFVVAKIRSSSFKPQFWFYSTYRRCEIGWLRLDVQRRGQNPATHYWRAGTVGEMSRGRMAFLGSVEQLAYDLICELSDFRHGDTGQVSDWLRYRPLMHKDWT